MSYRGQSKGTYGKGRVRCSAKNPVFVNGFKVESYLMRTYCGVRIGMRPKVTFPDGTRVYLTKKMSPEEAVKQAVEQSKSK